MSVMSAGTKTDSMNHHMIRLMGHGECKTRMSLLTSAKRFPFSLRLFGFGFLNPSEEGGLPVFVLTHDDKDTSFRGHGLVDLTI